MQVRSRCDEHKLGNSEVCASVYSGVQITKVLGPWQGVKLLQEVFPKYFFSKS